MAKTVKTRRVHCKIKHIDAYLAEYDDGRFCFRCPNRPHCKERPLEKGVAHKT